MLFTAEFLLGATVNKYGKMLEFILCNKSSQFSMKLVTGIERDQQGDSE